MKCNVRFAAAAVAVVVSLPAAAADMPVKAPLLSPVRAANWTGAYVGVHIGFSNVNDDATLQSAPAPLLLPLGTVISASDTAFIGGGQIGYNWQFGRWVTGIEGDISGTTHNYSVTAASTLIPGASLTATSKINWLATVTGRLGYTYADWLLYAKGGLAVMDATYGGSATVPGLGTLVVNSFSDTRTGWTVGAGVEKQWMGAWSWKAEYNYMNFGDTYSSTTTPPVGISVNKVDTEIHAVKLGLNYRFGSR